MRFRSAINSRPLLWAVLALPAAWIVYAYARGDLFYGKVIHITGDNAFRLLVVALAATPAMRLLPGSGVARWLIRFRREFGVASFGYALLHTLVYVLRKQQLDLMILEGREPGLLTGWIALALFLPLAITSNDASVRLLKTAWRRLHWLVYPAALLAAAHWLLEAFDLVPALIHGGVLLALLAARFIPRRRARSAS